VSRSPSLMVLNSLGISSHFYQFESWTCSSVLWSFEASAFSADDCWGFREHNKYSLSCGIHVAFER
jgi:hypothetical protein